MEKREGYKKTKIGWIPEDWDVVQFKNIVGLNRQKINSKDNGHHKCIELEHIDQGSGKLLGHAMTEGKSSIKTPFKPGDTLFGKLRPYLMKYCYPTFEGVCSTEIFVFRPKLDADSRFVFNIVQTEGFIANAVSKSFGTKMPRTNWSIVGDYSLPLPPLPEQQKIASILTTVDDKISSIEYQIQQTEQLKKGLMEKLLTEGIGHTEFKETKIGRIPKGWDVVKIFDVVEKIQDGNYGADYPKADEMLPTGVPFLTSAVISRNSRVDTSKLKYISKEKHELLKKAHLKKHDVLFTNRGANVGQVAINPDFLNGANIGPQLTLLRCKDKLMDYQILFFYLQSPIFNKILKSVDSGSAMNFLSIKTTGNFLVILPPLEEQKQIATILSTVDDKIEVLNQKKTHYQILKKGLSQQLLTGQMRVKI